jgi:tetratricopeptide (TPR) repeat protein
MDETGSPAVAAAASGTQTPVQAVSQAAIPAQAHAQAQADAEGWALLEGLRRRLDEQANQHRKTQTQVSQLAESIGALVETQRRRSRWLNINSFVAYLVFTLLCGGAFYLLYQSRAREVVADRDRVAHERDLAVQHSKGITEQLAARDAADLKAWDAFQLLESGKREEASKKLVELQKAPLSKLERTVLDGKAKQADIMQVDATLKNVAAAFKSARHAETIAPLEVALQLESVGPRAALMHYYLGVAYAKGGTLDKAIVHLQAAVEADVTVEDARFHYASALDRAGEWGKAKVEYERFATAHPMSPHTTYATRRSWGLARLPAVDPKKANAPAPAAAAPATAPAAATPSATAPATPPPAAAPPTSARAAAPTPAPAQPAATSAPRPAAPRPAPRPAPKQPAAEPTPPPKVLDFSEPE